MTTTTAILPYSTATPRERAMYAFLAEKQRCSGSMRTVSGYAGVLRHFFQSTKRTPDRVTSQDAFAWAYSPGLSGVAPSSMTIGARIAFLSSSFRFLIGMKMVAVNPCDQTRGWA